MNHSGCLRRFGQLPNGPATDFISSRSEEIDQIQGIISRFDNLRNHGSLLLIFVLSLFLLEVSTIRDNLSRNISINPILNLFQPFVLFAYEIFTTKIDQVND